MRQSRAALVLGGGLLLAAWALGSGAMAVAGIGVSLAGSWGLGWTWLVARRLTVARAVPTTVLTEGDELRYTALLRGAAVLPGSFALHDRLGPT
jgi:hypothetical protein